MRNWQGRFIVLIVLLVASSIIVSCASSPQLSEEIYGTWTNDGSNPDVGKCVISSIEWKAYHKISDNNPFSEGTVRVVTKWTDSEGNIWYKMFLTITGGAGRGKYQALYKLSKSATVLEGQFGGVADFDANVGFPKKFDPTDEYYWTFIRAQK